MKMIVTAPKVSVYGKVMKAGDEFECPDKEARLWGAMARAKPSEDQTETMRAEQDAQPRRRGRPPGTYARRDMRAEG